MKATIKAKDVALDVHRRDRERPNFGNGGAVRNLISQAQVSYSKRISSEPGKGGALEKTEESEVMLEPQNFDPEYNRRLRATKDFRSLFKDLVGFQDIIGTFEGYQRMTANMKQRGLEPRDEIPVSFVFKGPPGTGKTTTARALGHIYHSMGFLSTTEVIDCSVTDLVSSNRLTGKKVQSLLERGLGKVLFIDEAYRMGQRDLAGAFISRLAQETVGELVDCMTKEKFSGKLVIVLAGYEKDMDNLMKRMKDYVADFMRWCSPTCDRRTVCGFYRRSWTTGRSRLRFRQRVRSGYAQRLLGGLISSARQAWANARDVGSISKRITQQVFMKEILSESELEIALEDVTIVLEQFYQQRKSQGSDKGS